MLTNSMDVVFDVLWEVVVQHMRHVLNVDTSAGNVSCYQNLDLSGPQILQSLFPITLLSVSMDRLDHEK